MRRKRTPEGDIKQGIREFLTLERIFYWNVFSGPMAEPGIPDIIAILPVAGKFGRVGQFVGIEVKAPKGKLSPTQIEKRKLIEAAYGIYIEARSVSDVIKGLGLSGKYGLDQTWRKDLIDK